MKVIYYYHIPKCGGEYIKKHLMNLNESLGGKYINFNNLSQDKLINKLENRYYQTLKDIPEFDTEFVFIHHHHGYPGIMDAYNEIKNLHKTLKNKGHEFFLFTCIREPMGQIKSKLNYLINTGQVVDLSVNRLLTDEIFKNGMYKYLMYNHPNRQHTGMNLDKSTFDKCIMLFDRVFILEALNDLNYWLNSILQGDFTMPPEKINKSEHLIQPSKDQIKLLKQANHLDYYFFEIANKS